MMEKWGWTLFAVGASIVLSAAVVRAWRRARLRKAAGGSPSGLPQSEPPPAVVESSSAVPEPGISPQREVLPPSAAVPVAVHPDADASTPEFTPIRLPDGHADLESASAAPLAVVPSAGAPPASVPSAGGFVLRIRLPSLRAPLAGAASRLMLWVGSLDNVLFALALTVYAGIRLIGLQVFPIYFFTDEAVQTVLAADFVRDGFRDFLGHSFPTYFQNVYQFNLSLSVYAQILPYLLLGKSVDVTRGTAALLTVPGAVALGLTLRDIFRVRHWWAGVLLLSAAPAFFLHSRTAFETALMASCFACFLYFYLLYRTRSARWLFGALPFAAAVFYSYTPGQIIMAGMGIALLVIDAQYHWRNRRTLAFGLPLAILLALPFLRFRLQMPGELVDALHMLGSIWVQNVSLAEKLRFAVGNYLMAINPAYWYLPNGIDLARHVMKDYGHLMLWTLPLTLAGLVMTLRRLRSAEYRVLMASMLTIPLGATVIGLGITRVLSFVVPVTIMAALALDSAMGWIARRLTPKAVVLTAFAILTAVNVSMLRDSLVNGPLWFRDYGMTMQYGASQLFGAVQDVLRREPGVHVLVSPTWGNGIDVVKRFFIPDSASVEIANADGFLTEKKELNDTMLFVLTAGEYHDLTTNPKIANIRVERMLPFPDGSPGFYFLRMSYSPEADALFEQERIQRQKPIVESLQIDGQTVQVQHPLFDMGEIKHVFDGDPYTLARTFDANPAILVLTFPTPRALHGISVTTGSMDIALTVRLYATDASQPEVYTETYRGLPQDPTVHMAFQDPPASVSKIEIDIGNADVSGPWKVHLREIKLE